MTLRIPLLIAMLAAAACTAVFGIGKSTIDPNAAPRPAAASAKPADNPLDSKIAYEASAVRLHAVIDDLAKLSGATIFCGKDDDDWRVRDIPVTVATRDITLGKLLKYLAFSTHTLFKATKTENGTVYQIVSDPKMTAMLAEYENALSEYASARNAWSWDVASKLKDIPVSDITENAYSGRRLSDDDIARDQAASGLLASIDPNTKDRILAGEAVKLSPRTDSPELREAILSVLRAVNASMIDGLLADPQWREANAGSPAVTKASDQELQDSAIGVNLADSGPQMEFRVDVERSDSCGQCSVTSFQSESSTDSLARMVVANNKKHLVLSKEPARPEEPKNDPPNPNFRSVDKDTPGLPEKITPDLPADRKIAWPGDLLIAYAKASGMTLVCEDFSTSEPRDPKEFQGRDITSRKALLDLRFFDWMIDPKSKVMLGSDKQWPDKHKNLLPEKVIKALIAKANGEGVDLDDILPLTAYPAKAAQMWLNRGALRGLNGNIPFTEQSRPMWAFYNALADEQKSEAKSESGLPLSTIVSQPLLQAVKAYLKGQLAPPTFGGGPLPRAVIDPAVIPTLNLRLTVPKDLITAQANSGSLDRHRYCLGIVGKDGDKPVGFWFDSLSTAQLPFFSPEREKELNEKAKKASK